jgi:hypothetical protein
MKIRNLKRKSGGIDVSVWAKGWTSSFASADKFAVGEVGTLKSVNRVGNRLSLAIEYEGREHFGSLEWDAPPSLDAVEKALRDNIGKPIKTIGDLDVPER